MEELNLLEKKVSILVPVYGVEKYIGRCAESLFRQSYQNIEYIFVNDCTKDCSIETLQQVLVNFPERKDQVRIINHVENQGQGGTRLTGLMAATGEYIWFVDSDDWVETTALDTCRKYMNDGCDMIGFGNYVEGWNFAKAMPLQSLEVEDVLTNAISPSIWKCVVKRCLYHDYKIYPKIGVNNAEDFMMLARLVLVAKSKVLLSNELLYHYNVANMNSYTNNIGVRGYENSAQATLEVVDFYEILGQVEKYKVALGCRISWSFLLLKACEPSCELCEKLLIRVKSINTYIYVALRMPKLMAKVMIKLYKIAKL